jgi:23S rRNA pseudouridine1911/1915/1917 synthase
LTARRPWKHATKPDDAPPNAIVRVFRVPPELAGMRIDVFLSSQLRNTSRTRAKLIAEKGVYTLDGKKRHANDRVAADEQLAVWRAPPDESDKAVDLPTLYEDEHLLVIDKPPMLAVHPTARHHSATVIKLLQKQRPDEFFSLIHRIDRETSGILMIGRSPQADRAFKRYIEDRSIAAARSDAHQAPASPIRKTYLAITWGIPKPGIIDLPVERDPENPLRVKMRVAGRGGLESRTKVDVVGETPGYALVACELLTGRQHQIRIHLAAAGHPIVGDKLYGPDERMLARAADAELTDEDRAKLELPRQALHAHRYRLPHAMTGTELDLVSPLPEDLVAFWQARGGSVPDSREF